MRAKAQTELLPPRFKNEHNNFDLLSKERVKQLEAEGYIHQVDQPLSPGGSIEINADDLPSKLFSASFLSKLPYEGSLKAEERCEEKENSTIGKLPLPKLWLTMETERKVDVCLPRPLAGIIHRFSSGRGESAGLTRHSTEALVGGSRL